MENNFSLLDAQNDLSALAKVRCDEVYSETDEMQTTTQPPESNETCHIG